MSEYIFDVASKLGKIDWPGALQRSDAFPLDRSSVFSSIEDAKKYITGEAADERKLGATSYAGQIISVLDTVEVNGKKVSQIRPYLVQGIFDTDGKIIGRVLKELALASNSSTSPGTPPEVSLDPSYYYCINGGNAEQAQTDALDNIN